MSAAPVLPVELLTGAERERLVELEAIVERGLQTFVEVGIALREIRDARLYRGAHDTFEAYCRERWGFADSRARQLIAAVETVTTVTAAGLPAPANERQARELVPLLRDEGEQAVVEVYRELRDEYGDGITADRVQRLVRGRLERERREQELVTGRGDAEEVARGEIAAAGECPFELVVSDLRDWRPANVACVITDPPYIGKPIALYEALADFAVDVLPDGGALAVMTWQPILPHVYRALEHQRLVFRWELAWRYETRANTPDFARRIFDTWKPILVYHKAAMPRDARMFRDELSSAGPDKTFHPWGQSVEGFEKLVDYLSRPGEVVCDPFLGGGTTAVAALARGRRFVGCDVDAEAIETTRERLAA